MGDDRGDHGFSVQSSAHREIEERDSGRPRPVEQGPDRRSGSPSLGPGRVGRAQLVGSGRPGAAGRQPAVAPECPTRAPKCSHRVAQVTGLESQAAMGLDPLGRRLRVGGNGPGGRRNRPGRRPRHPAGQREIASRASGVRRRPGHRREGVGGIRTRRTIAESSTGGGGMRPRLRSRRRISPTPSTSVAIGAGRDDEATNGHARQP